LHVLFLNKLPEGMYSFGRYASLYFRRRFDHKRNIARNIAR